MIYANGIPKHGTHALLKAVELLGVPVRGRLSDAGAQLGHWPALDLAADDKHILIIRQPRNSLISWLRYGGLSVTQGLLSANMQDQINACREYLHWLDDPRTLIVRLEALVSDGGATVQAIADYLGVPARPDAYSNIYGHTRTWSGQHSDWVTCAEWTPDVEAAWQAKGGGELAEAIGYA